MIDVYPNAYVLTRQKANGTSTAHAPASDLELLEERGKSREVVPHPLLVWSPVIVSRPRRRP
ncbi:MAG: hypothetical protein ABR607_10180 [Pyrinomonadaceae bacterium]